jgi:hypothetical protein
VGDTHRRADVAGLTRQARAAASTRGLDLPLSRATRAAAQGRREDGAGLEWMVHDIVERFGRHALGTEGWRAEWGRHPRAEGSLH